MAQNHLTEKQVEDFANLAPTAYHGNLFKRWLKNSEFLDFFSREYGRIAKFTRNAQGDARKDALAELLTAHSLAEQGVALHEYHPQPNGASLKNPDLRCSVQTIRFFVEVKHLNITAAQRDVYNLLSRLEEAVLQAGEPYLVHADFFLGDQNELLPHEEGIKNFILEKVEEAHRTGATEIVTQFPPDRKRFASIRFEKRGAPKFSCGAMPGGSMHGPYECDKIIQAIGRIVQQLVPGQCNVAAMVADSSAYSFRELEIATTTICERLRLRDDSYFAGLTFRNAFRDSADFQGRLKGLAGYLYCDGIKWRMHPNWLSEDGKNGGGVWRALSIIEGAYL